MREVPSQFGLTDRLFKPVSVVGGPFIALMVLAPRAQLTQRVMRSNLLFLLYSGLFTILAGRAARERPEVVGAIMRMDVDTLAGFLGDRDLGVLTVWTHMTGSDMFIARWIYLDSLERGTTARLLVLVQALFGPVGLFLYLLTRGRARVTRTVVAGPGSDRA